MGFAAFFVEKNIFLSLISEYIIYNKLEYRL